MSNVYGLERFSEHMGGLAGCYAVIGGTACDILLSDADIAFRATKDIDVVLLIEERLPEVGRAVWDMVTDGGYTCGWRSSDSTHYYRFTEPTEPGYPSMIELFSRSPDFIEDPSGLTICPAAHQRRGVEPLCHPPRRALLPLHARGAHDHRWDHRLRSRPPRAVQGEGIRRPLRAKGAWRAREHA